MMIPFAGDEARIGNGQMGQNGSVQSAAQYRAQLSMQNPAFTQSVASLARRPIRSTSDLSLDKVAIANRSIGGRQGGERRISVGRFVGDNSIRFYGNNPMDTRRFTVEMPMSGGPEGGNDPYGGMQDRGGGSVQIMDPAGGFEPAYDGRSSPIYSVQMDDADGPWRGPNGGSLPLTANGLGGPPFQPSSPYQPRQGVPYPAFDGGNLPMMQADGMDGRWQGPYGGGSPLPSNGQGGPTSQSSPSVRPRQGIVVKI